VSKADDPHLGPIDPHAGGCADGWTSCGQCPVIYCEHNRPAKQEPVQLDLGEWIAAREQDEE
jgi:hypothetical protein